MNHSVITAIDTNILIDILEPDPMFGPASRERLKHCLEEGHVVACEAVWAEIATAYQTDVKGLLQKLEIMKIIYSPLSQETALEAAHCWYIYRQQGGTRSRIATDFLIGAHALRQCDRLLTRDQGFFRSYFQSLQVIDPTNGSL
jgi:hypothetical protein